MVTDIAEIDPNTSHPVHLGLTETVRLLLLIESTTLKLPDTEVELLSHTKLTPLTPERNLTHTVTSTLETDPNTRSQAHLGLSETVRLPLPRESTTHRPPDTVAELPFLSPPIPSTLERSPTLTEMYTPETDPNTKFLDPHGLTETETHLSSRPPSRKPV